MSTSLAKESAGKGALTTRPFGMRDKIGYMFGDFGNDFTFILQVMFFMLFYTKVVGINPVHVGTLFLVARILDAFTDVGMGMIVDRSKPRRDGKFKPWIRMGAIPVAVASALMYQSFIAGWDSYGARIAWMVVTYLLWGSITYTMINIPYGSMASVISADPKHRAELSVWRSTGANLAFLIISVVLPLVVYVQVDGVATLDPARMTWAAIIMAAFAVLFYALLYVNVEERVVVQRDPNAKHEGIGQLFKAMGSNRALLGIVLAALLLLIGNLLISAMIGYLFLDYFNSTSLQSVASLAALLPTFALIVIAPWLATRFGKRETAVAAMLIGGLVLVATSFLDLRGIPAGYVVLYALGQFMVAVFNFLIWAFITDVIDHQEVRTGQRDDGTIYAVYSWARKLGQAIAGGIGGWALGAIGYQTATGGAAVVQAEETVRGIYQLSTLWPGLLFIGVALVLQFVYPLSKKAVESNVTTLAERRGKAATAA